MSLEIPREHQLKCEGCNKVLDMRDPSVLSHGWIEDGKIVCYDEEPIKYSSSQKKGEAILWSADKTKINLN